MKEEVKKNKREKEEVKMKKELKELVREKEESKMMKKEEEKIMKKEENKIMKEESKMMKEESKMKELVKEIEEKKVILMEKVMKWVQTLNPIKDLHIKEKGRYYPMIEKTGKLSLIDKVQSRKIPFNTLDQNMKFVIASILAERKEEIEKEVEEDKKKYLEKKLNEIENLLNKF